jgi:class 3 adenylate cyclase/tetratricopeptide (TPR) repeat protein
MWSARVTRRSHALGAARDRCYKRVGVRYRVLGPLAVEGVADHPALRRHKPRALLALLLLHANEVVSTDTLLDGLWGESPPPRALGSLQNNVSHLRKALGEETLITQSPGYVLRVEPDELDSALFERLVDEAAACEPPERAERLRSALGLWRGPPFADFTFEPFAQNEIRRLEELRLSALEERIDAELALGLHADLVGELESRVAEHPLRERLRGQLMLALFRSGRQADALAAYRDGRQLLREELGLEPGEELRRLERAILEQEADLQAVAAPPRVKARPVPTVRKIVTVLFADVAGHTHLATTLDPEALRNVMRRFFTAMSAVIERHGGTLEKFSGDDVMAVFGVPVVHEDDGLRAVRAATEMRSALTELGDALEREHGVRLAMRLGINTGEVIAGADEPLVTGEAVNVAKRLQQSASPGDIVLGPVTRSLVRDAVTTEPIGPLELRGRPEPLSVFRLLDVAEAPAASGPARAPFVGRRKELRRLRAAYTRARDKRKPVIAVVLGDAGIGKSRLARELVASIADEADVLVGRCVSYGQGATYLPLADIVRQATREASLDDQLADVPDGPQIARGVRALSAPEEAVLLAAEISWAFRRFLETLASRRPLVLVLEDLHWAEPTLLDLVEYLAGHSDGVPLVVLTVARPDLIERRPQWSESADARVVVTLEPLTHDDTDELVSELAGDSGLDANVRNRIARTAEGNPLFAEQLLAFLAERGPEWLDYLPPTVEALLASRLDGLDAAERTLLERAAVIGTRFGTSELVALSPPEEAGVISGALTTLVRRSFIRPRRVTPDAFAFRHGLIRDAAYAAVPKLRRAELHERFADWLAQRADSPDEVVGYHLERAYRLLVELGPLTRHARQLAGEAGERLGTAGMRAFKTGDISATTNLLGRATSLLPTSELLCELALARRLSGDLDGAVALLGEAIGAAEARGDQRMRLRAEVELASVQLFGSGDAESLLELASAAVPTFEVFGDDRSLGRAWVLIGFVRGGFQCQNEAWEEAAERALHHYQRIGWPTYGCVGELVLALYFGPRHVEQALARAASLLESGVSDRLGEAHVLTSMAGLEAFRGRFDEARRLVAYAQHTYEELGASAAAAAGCAPIEASIEMLAGEWNAAEMILRSTCELFMERGESAFLATRAAQLADSLYAQDRLDEAARWIDLAEQHSSETDVSAEFSWRSIRAKLLAQEGACDAADVLAREAVRLVETTDALNQQGEVFSCLAEVQRLAHRTDEATQAFAEAARRFSRKGNLVSAARAAEFGRNVAAV